MKRAATVERTAPPKRLVEHLDARLTRGLLGTIESALVTPLAASNLAFAASNLHPLVE